MVDGSVITTTSWRVIVREGPEGDLVLRVDRPDRRPFQETGTNGIAEFVYAEAGRGLALQLWAPPAENEETTFGAPTIRIAPTS